MAEPIQSITIVGGGTAGWLAAAYLNAYLSWRPETPAVEVTVIESPNVPTVGVGEATVPRMSKLLSLLGIGESEFFRRCNASFKLGVQFNAWNQHEDGSPRNYLHPFNTPREEGELNPGYLFHRFVRDPHVYFGDVAAPNRVAVAGLKGPRAPGDPEFQGYLGYAYHLDAGLFARFLREVCTGRGVKHILDDVVDVGLDDHGFVSHLQLKERGRHPVDLVVDCTGFRGLIINEKLGEPFISYGNHLLCDSAVAVQIPHEDGRRIEPCTTSTALTGGWSWRVPLYNRVGTGYVFSSRFKSDDEAISELLEFLGPRASGTSPRVLKMRVGRTRRSWVKNCVAVGLSGGFIEPLESTAIYMIDMAAQWIVDALPDRDFDTAVSGHFNRLMQELQDEIRDFIVAHYLLSNRPEPFWKTAREEIDVPDSLKENLALWKRALPTPLDTKGDLLFDNWNYQYVLFGKGYFDDVTFPLERVASEKQWRDYAQQSARIGRALSTRLPDHYELICSVRNEGLAVLRQPGGRGAERAPPPPVASLDTAASIL